MKNRIKIEPLRDRFYNRSDPVEEVVRELEGRRKGIQNTTRRNEEGRGSGRADPSVELWKERRIRGCS